MEYEDDLIERILSRYDADTILELLRVDAEELVERFRNEILDNAAYWEEQL